MEFTRSVISLYFSFKQSEKNLETPGTIIHNYFVADTREIVLQIKSLGDIANWVEVDEFTDDIVSQLFFIIGKFVKGYIGKDQLEFRLLHAVATSFIGISIGETKAKFEIMIQQQRITK